MNFESYKKFLEGTLSSLIKNGESQNRVKQLKAFSTLSKGYDSPAVTCMLKDIADFDCATINVANSNMRCDRFKSTMIINQLSKSLQWRLPI